ncbi:S-adenosyl-L-methionine-dependent methyltransferase [Hypoxylon sp. FL1284]|nr:S-adenosyl-L-methionine-dependent methyltransferase [Hypoxylon sp. FL1284]
MQSSSFLFRLPKSRVSNLKIGHHSHLLRRLCPRPFHLPFIIKASIANTTMDPSFVKQHFQQHASAYEKDFGATSSRLAAATLARLPLSSYSASSHILDSAAGPGIVAGLLLSPSPADVSVPGLPVSPAPRITAIDVTPAMIGSFMANKATFGWETADAFVQDSQDLSRFEDAEFDAVVMNLGIFALRDSVAGAAEMHRVLKPGGYVAVTTWKVRRIAEVMQGAVDAIRPNSGLRAMEMPAEWATRKTR